MFPNNIATIRRTRKMSQNNLAAELGTSRQTISLYECGQKQVPPHHIKILCRVLKCNEADLFFWK